MPNQTDVLKQLFRGRLKVTIENAGTLEVDAIDEPLCMLAAQVDALLDSASVSASIDDHPYELVSFDREQAKLVVRKK